MGVILLSFELNDIKELLELNLNPIKSDINELKLDQKELRDDQKKIIDIISVQSEHNVQIHNLEKEMDECKEDRLRMDADREKMKEKGNNRLWEVLRYGGAVVLGGLINHFSFK